MPVRVRLTVWYLVTLALILVVFGSILYWQSRRSLLMQMDDTLRLAASQASLNIAQDGQLEFTNIPTLQASIAQIDNDLTLQLVDEHGTVLDWLSNDEDEPDNDEYLPSHVQTDSIVTAQTFGQGWRIYSKPLGNGIWLQVGQGTDVIEDNLNVLVRQMLYGLPIALLFAGMVGSLLAQGALQPVDQMTQTAQTITGSDLSQRIGYTGVQDEIGRLATTFDTMLARLEATFKQERRFTNDAAHELRTPLTALKGQIDVTLSKPRSAQEYVSALTGLNQQVDRLINLSNSLLFMARIDQGSWRVDKEPLDLQDFIPAIVDLIRPMAEEKQIAIIEEIDPVTINANPDLLIQCLLNLLDNALNYSEKDTTITLQAKAGDDTTVLHVQDTGSGIAEEHLPYLFDRFYRVDQSRTHSGGREGTGLGLAIVKRIVDAHDGTIIVNSTLDEGTTFTIELPHEKPRS